MKPCPGQSANYCSSENGINQQACACVCAGKQGRRNSPTPGFDLGFGDVQASTQHAFCDTYVLRHIYMATIMVHVVCDWDCRQY